MGRTILKFSSGEFETDDHSKNDLKSNDKSESYDGLEQADFCVTEDLVRRYFMENGVLLPSTQDFVKIISVISDSSEIEYCEW
ncbi:unnamed protein product [Phytomonas sp. EM1]|nr:unnamed protein product [Phytomonas sp. EM1]|eukprot:CCW65769.1 unnamed protein product [Phytomonas sp. isolate EM1]